MAARERCRSALWEARQLHRNAELGRRRVVPSADASTEESVLNIANKLKTSTAVSTEDLATLKNALIMDGTKIDMFLQTHGALRGLVRELTGSDTVKQTLAAACCCNLALGEVRSTQVIAKVVGSYLLLCLDSLNKELAVTSAWTLGNLAGSHPKVCEILISQGAMSKLASLLCADDEEMQEALSYALVHFMYVLKHDVRFDTLSTVFDALKNMRRNSETYHLLYLLTCHPQFSTLASVNTELVGSIMEDLSCLGENEMDTDKMIHLVRVLANICASPGGSDCVVQFFKNPVYLSQLSNILLRKNAVLHRSVLWLLGNIYNFGTYDDEKKIFFMSISENILF